MRHFLEWTDEDFDVLKVIIKKKIESQDEHLVLKCELIDKRIETIKLQKKYLLEDIEMPDDIAIAKKQLRDRMISELDINDPDYYISIDLINNGIDPDTGERLYVEGPGPCPTGVAGDG